MSELVGVIGATVLVLTTIVLIPLIAHRHASMPLEKKYETSGGGLSGAFDAVWSPTAHEAGMERDRQTARTAPAPSPGDPPNGIQGSRITLDL